MPIGPRLMHELLHYQHNEITEHYFYKRLAASIRSPQNRAVLEKISDQELRHYHIWRHYTRTDFRPGRIRLWGYLILARLIGFTFAIKLMELSETEAQARYKLLYDSIPEACTPQIISRRVIQQSLTPGVTHCMQLDQRNVPLVSAPGEMIRACGPHPFGAAVALRRRCLALLRCARLGLPTVPLFSRHGLR